MTPTYDAKSPKQAIDIKVKYVVFHIFPRLLGGREHKRAAHLMPSLWMSCSSGSYSSINFNNTIYAQRYAMYGGSFGEKCGNGLIVICNMCISVVVSSRSDPM